TESTTPSPTRNMAGTLVERSSDSPGSVIARRRVHPESGATGVTGLEKSNTTRVLVGADHERSPVRPTEPRVCAPAPAALSERAGRGSATQVRVSARPT